MELKAIEYKADEQSEANEKKLIDETVQKWLLLQKTVKEEITLEEIILNQQQSDFNNLKNLFKQYYEFKLKSRKINEDIRNLKINAKNKNDKNAEIKEYIIDDEIDKTFLQACEPVKNLLFLFRNNYDYVLKLISLIDYQDEKEQIESLVELLCNQFYDNILIPNPEQEELLILIYKLLEEEITPMNSASIDEFLHDSTFLGKFISSFMKRQELNVFLSILLNPIIEKIENKNDGCLDMSLFSIQNFISNTGGSDDAKRKSASKSVDKSSIGYVTEENLFSNIPKTKIQFKKNLQIYAEKAEKSRKDNYIMETPNENDSDLRLINMSNKNGRDSKAEDVKEDINPEYSEDLTQEKLNIKLKQAKDNDLKDFYEHQLEQINTDPDIFSNKGLIEVLNEQCFQDNKDKIMSKYKTNFLFIQKRIDEIIQSLIDKITSIPYTLRCISKIISILISKKFPLLSKYLQNAFIGKFIFNKCIFPVLSLENKNVVENIIFGLDTKKCLNVIISVLSTANKCLLFNCNTDTEKTIFNYYLIEIIPILNKFYEKLIDIELPKALNDLVSKTKNTMDESLGNNFFSFRRKQSVTKTITNKGGENTTQPLYDYFSENSDEIMRLQCICFSLSDIMFIISLINKDKNVFNQLPEYDSFQRTFERITAEEYKLDQKLEAEKTQRKFFIIYKDEKNSQLEKLFRHKNKKISEKNLTESEMICLKIKNCIKTILKGLNVLNNKDYSYLNMATSNEKFLDAIQYTLQDIGEFSEDENKIPLNWYGQFIVLNKNGLSASYLENDLKQLYEELYNEETNTLNELKSFSSIIITRDGMNLRCSENILEKIKYNYRRLQQAKKFQKIENFIDKDKTEVCIRIKDENEKEKEKEKSGNAFKSLIGKKDKKDAKNEQLNSFVYIVDANDCPHKNVSFMASIEGQKSSKKITTHAENVNDFISKFSDNKNKDLKNLNKYIEDDIKSGKTTHEVFKLFSDYMEFLKRKIKAKSEKYLDNPEETDKQKIEAEINEFANKIEEHIMRKTYKYVFPKNPLKEDKEFYKQTKMYDWITPEHLEIKKLYNNQLDLALACMRRMDDATSVFEKIRCVINAFNNINNTIKFSTGKNENAGQDEMTPVFQYITIKAHPKRFISNINYIKCFKDLSQGGQISFLVTQLESTLTFIRNINRNQLKISEEEYNKNMKQAKEKFESMNK